MHTNVYHALCVKILTLCVEYHSSFHVKSFVYGDTEVWAMWKVLAHATRSHAAILLPDPTGRAAKK